MDWLLQFIIDVAKGIAIGVPSFLLGLWIYTRFVAAKQASDIAVRTADAILKHPKIKPQIDKLQQTDFNELVEKAKELLTKLEGLDWATIADTLKSLKVAIEVYSNDKKRVIPAPEEKTKQ